MPLREDLLTPIAGENPSGEDLYYDKVFEQIKEARKEDLDDLPEGAWAVSQKKRADNRTVIKQAGESLAKKSKDLRLAGWLVEAHLRTEGFSVLVPCIEFIKAIQENFWPTLYPVIEDGNDIEMRMVAAEQAASIIFTTTRRVPLTKSGLTFEDYLESRRVGFEKDATSNAKKEARADAIKNGRLTAEDFDSAFAESPKVLYSSAEAVLVEAQVAAEQLDEYQEGVYGDNAPSLSKLRDGLNELHMLVESLLNEKRKTEPDPVVVVVDETPPDEGGDEADSGEGEVDAGGEPTGQPTKRRAASAGQPSDVADAYAMVVESAQFLFEKDSKSPVPYLVCSGLRLGETRMQGETPAPGFAVGPSSEVRQSLRTLASKGDWHKLLRASLPILASECARTWLDLHRYIWRAGQETGAVAISDAVVGTVKNLLIVRPEIRFWTLEDDTGTANPETQQWLDLVVLR